MTEAHGIALVLIVNAVNRNTHTQLLPRSYDRRLA